MPAPGGSVNDATWVTVESNLLCLKLLKADIDTWRVTCLSLPPFFEMQAGATMDKLSVIKKLEADFLPRLKFAIDGDLFKHFDARPQHPQAVPPMLQEISYDLQMIASLLESYPDHPLRPRLRKGVVKLQYKLALDLTQLNGLLLEVFKPKNACCALSAKLNDPLIKTEYQKEVRKFLSCILDH
jgi:hypothetical protein